MVAIEIEQDGWRKPRSKKDTQRWCKGKVGREHTPATEQSEWRHDGRTDAVYRTGFCSTCGKRLKEYDGRADLPVLIQKINGRRQ